MNHHGSTLDAEEEDPVGILFYEALRIPSQDRGSFLDERCGGDHLLRREVESMLKDHENAGSFLGSDAPLFRGLEEELARRAPEGVGRMIGPYKLRQQIGEGGFGTVWMAEQEKPVRRRVALKIIKLGMDTKEVVARFEQERQALAMMDHPNIARVLDAGATPLGRPYFVMELVRGIKITDYCDQVQLPTLERLKLFVQVCHAVQHAHQKGVIHRDLKPSNILVTLHDGVPVPKIIDFGIAKATESQRLSDLTVVTRFEQMIGTPAYMSPEQAEMSGLDIDTRTDIYSLGVLLYELLTGGTPFDGKKLLAEGLEAMRRTIREEEPARPSTRLSTLPAPDLTTVAKNRQSPSPKLTHAIRGDLDWIVMKTLEKDRSRRYETANALALDIQRHLASEPVHARPPSTGYRFRRLVKRHRAAFTSAAAILLALLAGLALATWMYFKEKDARQRAVAAEQEQIRLRQLAEEQEKKASNEAGKSTQIARFLEEMLKGVGPSVAQGDDTRLLRKILDTTAERLGTELKDQPEVEAQLRSVLGSVYRDLGDYKTAEKMFQTARKILSARFGEEDQCVAGTLHALAFVLSLQNKLAEAERIQTQVLAMMKKAHGEDHSEVANALASLAHILGLQGRLEEAEILQRKALTIVEKCYGDQHAIFAFALEGLANCFVDQAKWADAEPLYREALTIRKNLAGADKLAVATPLCNLARVLAELGRREEAEAMHREALALKKQLFGNDHPEVASSLNNLAAVLQDLNRFEEAEALSREALVLNKKLFGYDHPQVAASLNNLAAALYFQNKFKEAEPFYREALELMRRLEGDWDLRMSSVLHALGEILLNRGALTESEAMHREDLAICRKRFGPVHEDVALALESLGFVLVEQGRSPEAEPLLREGLEIGKKLRGETSTAVTNALYYLAEALIRQRKYAEAEALHREALQILRDSHDGEHERIARALCSLASVLNQQAKLAEAETVYREALVISRNLQGDNHPLVAQAFNGLRAALRLQGKLPEVESLLREELAAQKKKSGDTHPAVTAALANLAGVIGEQGRKAEAADMHRQVMARIPGTDAKELSPLGDSLLFLAEYLRQQNEFAVAEPLYRQLIAGRQARKQGGGRLTTAQTGLARLLSDWAWSDRDMGANKEELRALVTERAREAERLLRDGIAWLISHPTGVDWHLADLQNCLGGALVSVAAADTSLGNGPREAKLTEAEWLLLESNEALQTDPRVDRKFKISSLNHLVRLYEAWKKPGKAAPWRQRVREFERMAATAAK